MVSGHFVPYQKLGVLVAVITSFVFSIILSHDVVFEAPVAVVDLDGSRWSADLIKKLDASAYISVREVTHSPADARELTKHDRVQAVFVIPKNAQAELARGSRSVRLGAMLDDSNTAQNGELLGQVNEIVAELSAEVAVSRSGGVASLGKNESETAAMLSPLRVAFRYLSNPTGQGSTGTVVSFLLFFSLMYHGLTSLMIVGRLRVTQQWESKVLSGTLAAFLARGIPYAFIYTTVVMTAIAIMTIFGQLRFAGNPFIFMLALFFGALANTWVAMLLSWGATNPGAGASRMIFLVPPGFILGGATMALGFVHGWVYLVSHGIPLVWIFKFWRDVGLRGMGWSDMWGLIGAFLCYLVFLAALVGIRFWRDEMKAREALRESWRTLGELENRNGNNAPAPAPAPSTAA